MLSEFFPASQQNNGETQQEDRLDVSQLLVGIQLPQHVDSQAANQPDIYMGVAGA